MGRNDADSPNELTRRAVVLRCSEWSSMRQNVLNDSDVLEYAQNFVVQRHRSRDLPDGAALFDNKRFDACLTQPAGSNRSRGAETHNYNVELRIAPPSIQISSGLLGS